MGYFDIESRDIGGISHMSQLKPWIPYSFGVEGDKNEPVWEPGKVFLNGDFETLPKTMIRRELEASKKCGVIFIKSENGVYRDIKQLTDIGKLDESDANRYRNLLTERLLNQGIVRENSDI
jgi:hypothetical protein